MSPALLPPPADRPTRCAPRLDRAVLAHRGLPSRFPENTMASFRAAIEAGAAWIETDVDLAGDGTPVLVHDTFLDRTTDRRGRLYSLTASDLAGAGAVDAGSWFGPAFTGEPLPTLPQLIDLLRTTGTGLNIELKANEEGAARSLALVDTVAECLEQLDDATGVIVSSFSQPLLMAFHERHPEWATGVLFDEGAIGPDWLSVAELCGASFIHPGDRGLERGWVSAAREAGYGVNVWTVNRADRANELFNWGATGVFTDAVDALGHLAR